MLIGKNTDKRKHVDREIGSSLRKTKWNKRSGLLGILLPEHPCYNDFKKINKSNTQKRFVDNLKKDYAVLVRWDDIRNDAFKLKGKIQKAFENKDTIDPNNSEVFRKHNTSD